MSRAFWGMLFGIALVSGTAAAQETPPPTGPVSVTTLPHPSGPDATDASGYDDTTPADCNHPMICGGGEIGMLPCPAASWFFDVESDFLKPRFIGFLNGPVNIGGFFTDTVQLPNAPLYWTAAPRVEIGFRMPEGFGEIIVGYRNLVSEGEATILNFDPLGNGDLQSRLDVNTLDVDYGQHPIGLDPCWDVKWRFGLRLMEEYHDAQAIGLMLEQHATNQFLGAGPHASVEVWRHLDWHRLSLYSRLDGATLVGQIEQSYEEVWNLPDGPVGGTNRLSATQVTPMLNFEAGASWTPWTNRRLQVTAGYEIEGWWYMARTDSGSRGNLSAQGLFLRGEWGY